MAIITIKGSDRHGDVAEQHVRRAAAVLSAEFGVGYASIDEVNNVLGDPDNVLFVSSDALAVVTRAGLPRQRLWLMWVDSAARGRGVGSQLLNDIVTTYAQEHLMRLQCPAAREGFYARHGFHRLFTAEDGAYVHMAGPAKDARDVQVLLPPALRRRQ